MTVGRGFRMHFAGVLGLQLITEYHNTRDQQGSHGKSSVAVHR